MANAYPRRLLTLCSLMALATCIVLLHAMVACTSGGSGTGNPIVTRKVSPAGDELRLSDNERLVIPDGALAAETFIAFERTTIVPSEPAFSAVYRVHSDALAFLAPVQIVLPLTSTPTQMVLRWGVDAEGAFSDITGQVTSDGSQFEAQINYAGFGFIGKPQCPFICSTPPANVCKNEQTVLRYASYGTCLPDEAQCRYSVGEVPCHAGCDAGACKPFTATLSNVPCNLATKLSEQACMDASRTTGHFAECFTELPVGQLRLARFNFYTNFLGGKDIPATRNMNLELRTRLNSGLPGPVIFERAITNFERGGAQEATFDAPIALPQGAFCLGLRSTPATLLHVPATPGTPVASYQGCDGNFVAQSAHPLCFSASVEGN